jgi:predicted dinucleotide-binding enzyme
MDKLSLVSVAAASGTIIVFSVPFALKLYSSDISDAEKAVAEFASTIGFISGLIFLCSIFLLANG